MLSLIDPETVRHGFVPGAGSCPSGVLWVPRCSLPSCDRSDVIYSLVGTLRSKFVRLVYMLKHNATILP